MLFLFGLIGFYLVQAEKSGRLGSIGFVLTFFGVLVLTAQIMVSAWILPVIALQPSVPNTAYAMLDPAGPLPIFSSVVFAAYIPAGIGLILLGIATMRAHVLPRWAGLLLIIATSPSFTIISPWAPNKTAKSSTVAIIKSNPAHRGSTCARLVAMPRSMSPIPAGI